MAVVDRRTQATLRRRARESVVHTTAAGLPDARSLRLTIIRSPTESDFAVRPLQGHEAVVVVRQRHIGATVQIQIGDLERRSLIVAPVAAVPDRRAVRCGAVRRSRRVRGSSSARSPTTMPCRQPLRPLPARAFPGASGYLGQCPILRRGSADPRVRCSVPHCDRGRGPRRRRTSRSGR